jgi:hypothetical protein
MMDTQLTCFYHFANMKNTFQIVYPYLFNNHFMYSYVVYKMDIHLMAKL